MLHALNTKSILSTYENIVMNHWKDNRDKEKSFSSKNTASSGR